MSDHIDKTHADKTNVSRRTRAATPRRYLMCEPRYFDVDYSINPWMDPPPPRLRDALQPRSG